MTRAQWERVRALFEQVVEEPPADLDAWLSSEAGDDPDVRAEVASLLDHHTRAGGFIAEPVVSRVPGLLEDGETHLAPGQVIGAYSILREAGHGGMGRVYVATDTRLNRTVAIKVLFAGHGDDAQARERLRREARAAAALTHPGICTVHALEELDGEIFIVSEYVDGRTLREEIADGQRPSPAGALATARELAAALGAAHARGITHRDLKPENVMRTRDGRLKILDFGLARSDGPATDPLAVRVTQDAVAVGTPAYMAPEQLNGERVDARADVFALGVLLYEYVSGAHPFEAPNQLALISRILSAEAEPVERRVPRLPAVLAGVIARCLRKSPGERYSDAREVLAALDGRGAAMAPSDVPADLSATRATTGPGRARFWWRTHQAVIVVLYVLAAIAAWWVKEWTPVTVPFFVGVGTAGAVGGILRGHLLFTERENPASFAAQRARTGPPLMVVDLAMALAILGGGGC